LRGGDALQGIPTNGVPAPPAYHYHGEKYGQVTVQWSDALSADVEQLAQLKALQLDKAIVNHLLKHQLYSRSADHSIAVLIDGFGFPDLDDLRGTVTLKQKDGVVLASFRIDTRSGAVSSPYGFSSGSPLDQRIGYLTGEFGELTSTTILNPEALDQGAAQTTARRDSQ
jgi:hypothetical protein